MGSEVNMPEHLVVGGFENLIVRDDGLQAEA
jgi:hypothetical protein